MSHKILVSHESPIDLLPDSLVYNDYQYCLVHLLEENEKYHDWFTKNCKTGLTEVLLDNSIFELGEAFDSDKYAHWIEQVEPNHFIVPDVLQDADATMAKWEAFMKDYKDVYPKANRIGVVQGKTFEDIVRCYKFMDAHADYIAISFDYDLYLHDAGVDPENSTREEKLAAWAKGRWKLIDALQFGRHDNDVWNFDKPHHLLGCSLPQEFKNYRGDDSIRSIDTSNPVVAGIKGIRYNVEFGLKEKPTVLLADLINHDVNNSEWVDIQYNLDHFKKIIGRDTQYGY